MQKKVILITGASSGFGFELAKELGANNHIVYGVARNKEKLKELEQYGVNIAVCDVQKDEDIKNLVNRIIMEVGVIDVLYCNAGYGLYSAIESASIEKVQNQFDVNVLGTHRVIKEVLPYMRERKDGRIVITTSVVANVSIPFGGWYAASKHALKAVAESLSMEVKDIGIKVITIEPGRVETNFHEIASSYLNNEEASSDYKELKEKYINLMDHSKLLQENTMNETVYKMMHAGLSEKPKSNYKTTLDSVLLSNAKKILGSKLYYNMVLDFIKRY